MYSWRKLCSEEGGERGRVCSLATDQNELKNIFDFKKANKNHKEDGGGRKKGDQTVKKKGAKHD